LILRRQVTLGIAALQFLTRLPAPRLVDFQPDWVTRSARYFPLVGQLVGAIAALAWLGGSQLWSPPVASLLALAAGLLATGALHEDGLADSADCLFGGATPARAIEIMKDSRIGAYGVLALVVILGLKAAALASLAPLTGALALIAAHGIGRAAAVAAMRATPYAPEGRPTRWTPTEGGVRTGELLVAVAIATWPLALLAPAAALAGLVGAVLGGSALAAFAQRRLGGHTGDVLGAVEQLAETGFLLGVTAAVRCA